MKQFVTADASEIFQTFLNTPAVDSLDPFRFQQAMEVCVFSISKKLSAPLYPLLWSFQIFAVSGLSQFTSLGFF